MWLTWSGGSVWRGHVGEASEKRQAWRAREEGRALWVAGQADEAQRAAGELGQLWLLGELGQRGPG